MVRDLDRLSDRTFDLLVVGGGIYGLMTAYDGVTRGLSVALVERDDFGSGASFNHLRTIHGGLRYLQTLDFARARESVRERRVFARIAPLAVRPIAFALPLFPSVHRGKLAMRLGLLLDRAVASDRNENVPSTHHLPHGVVLSRHEAFSRFPALRSDQVRGAAVWYDYLLVEADRLTFSVALAADASGAALANRVEALSLLTDGRRVVGARVQDGQTGRAMDVAARVTVNATGGAVDRLLGPLQVGNRVPMLAAMNLVTRRPAIAGGAVALGGRSRKGRNLFTVPVRGRAVFGTWESTRLIDSDDDPDLGASEQRVVEFVGEVNEAFPAVGLTPADVTLVHRGAVPARLDRSGGVHLEGREQVRTHEEQGIDGLITVAGTKYTTARAVAERIVNAVFRKLGQEPEPCRTAVRPLLPVPEQALDEEVPPAETVPEEDLQSHLLASYGLRYDAVLNLCEERPDWGARVSDDSPVITAELVWAVRHEMALNLVDALVRRTPLGALGDPGEAVIERAAEIVGSELKWTDAERRRNIDEVRRFYRLRAI